MGAVVFVKIKDFLGQSIIRGGAKCPLPDKARLSRKCLDNIIKFVKVTKDCLTSIRKINEISKKK